MRIFLKLWLLSFVLLGLISCGKTKTTKPYQPITFAVNPPSECSMESQKKYVYDVMHDSYLWADDVANDGYRQDQDDESLLERLKNQKDHFSFIMPATESQSYFQEGVNDGFGLDFQPLYMDENEDNIALVLLYTYKGSPAQKAGLLRGDGIVKVDGQTVNSENYQTLYRRLRESSSIELEVLRGANTFQVSLQKARYQIHPILHHEVFNGTNGNRVGYMVFQDFIDTAIPEVDEVFRYFKEQRVTDLVLDLRYNGGGSDRIANHLSTLIAGRNVAGKIFHQTIFNRRYARYNTKQHFERSPAHALHLNRVFVLTTPNTCSASELVINALRASSNHVQVIQIGDRTCGKPYGYAQAGVYCDKALYAINMGTQNSDGVGDYVDGLAPMCYVEDDYTHGFGEVGEGMLGEALYYISTGSCYSKNVKSTKAAFATKKVLELPKEGFRRISNAF